jgi:tRNA-(ms[2]io[6]A)-hydroxylase
MDRLMVSALIEARSCERFLLLGQAATDSELRRLYEGLWRSERGHYLVFIELARGLPGIDRPTIEQRWDDMLNSEAQIIAAQPPGPRMHSGVENE